MPRDVTKNFIRERRFSPSHCAHGSFRTKAVGEHGTKVVLCCPTTRWNRKKKLCKTSMKVQTVLKPK
jgi:hypothetical protein